MATAKSWRRKCYYCKKMVKWEDATVGRVAVKGKYITKSSNYFHKPCWKKYASKYE